MLFNYIILHTLTIPFICLMTFGDLRAQCGGDIIFHVTNRQKCEKPRLTDIQMHGLRGKVKTVSTALFSSNISIHERVPVHRGKKREERYDVNGTLTDKMISFENSPIAIILKRTLGDNKKPLTDLLCNSDSSYCQLTQYKYDSATGMLTAEYIRCCQIDSSPDNTIKKYDLNGNCTEEESARNRKRYTYNEKGNCVMMEESAGHFHESKFVTIYTYDDSCRLIRAVRTGPDTVYTTYKYYENDSLVEQIQTNLEENTTLAISYKYDDHGNNIEVNQIVNTHSEIGEMPYNQKSEYKYDNKGNWISRTRHFSNRPFIREERSITYY
ncbi:MAG: hypothetical protein JWO03_4133 [Bacteroidetes bacterium]|nr:hypothetical protein [Bacteroidota bacterium]